MLKNILSLWLLALAIQASAQTVTNIAYLRTLVDPVNYVPTNTTDLFTVEGVVTTHTNITTPANAQFYIQDNTAGITVFVSGSSTIRPSAGDLVRVIGPLGHFNGLLELNLLATNASHSVTTVSTNNPLPAATLLQFSWQNDPAIIELQEGKYVVASNVFLDASTPTFPSGQTLLITNGTGETFTVFIDARTDIVGQTKPVSAVSIFGVLGQRDTSDPRTTGYQLIPTRYADFVGGAKPPVVRFTNVLENLVRPGDLPVNSFAENVLRPGEKLALQVVITGAAGPSRRPLERI
ncbi:MAG: hypothetical protein DME26_15515 [Verrucomicrobia bacterium]|nr:MAG: hypothetical protein DME26_15515 [Verrucomicrobiota bacterium]